MYVIEVIPLKRAVQIESLSYFSGDAYAPGTILTIPIRNQQTRGVVISTEPVSGAKTALRAATFSLRKLPKQPQTETLSPAFMGTVSDLAEYYACNSGAILYELLPPEIRDGKIPIPHNAEHGAHERQTPELLYGTTEERYDIYRALVRETFAHAGSVVIVVPGTAEAVVATERLSAGIEDRVITLTSTMTVRQLRTAYTQLEDFRKSKLIIATSAHAVLERHDVTTVIVERAGSSLYRERTRPYLDTRIVQKIHARHTGRRLIYGDLLPRSEDEVLCRDEIYLAYSEPKKRVMLPGKLSIVKMKDKPHADTPFVLFAPQTLNAIETTRAEKGNVFLFAARRGLTPVVSCLDCGHIFRCPQSGAPYSLVRITRNGEEQRWFVDGVSGKRERAADVCPSCGGWRLRERGIGIQHVYDELTKVLPDVPIIMFDHTSANTHKKASFLAEKFYGTKGALMLGTPMALPYLTKPITTSVVVNMDALRATPTWRGQEETFRTLLELRERTTSSVYLQTRTEPDELLEYVRTGAIEKFYDEEIALRKQFKYPPYAHFVHLTWQGAKEAVLATEQVVDEHLQTYSPTYYSAPPMQQARAVRNGNKRVTHIRYALIRLPASQWPDQKLAATLRALPPNVRIVMNPDRIV